PPPPVVVVTRPAKVVQNYVVFGYDLRDPQVKPGAESDPRVHVIPQYRDSFVAPGGTPVWHPMTEAQDRASEGTRALPLGSHTFVWNTLVDVPYFQGAKVVRVLAEYEDTEGIHRKWQSRETTFTLDNRLGATVFGADVGPENDVDTFPIDLRGDA